MSETSLVTFLSLLFSVNQCRNLKQRFWPGGRLADHRCSCGVGSTPVNSLCCRAESLPPRSQSPILWVPLSWRTAEKLAGALSTSTREPASWFMMKKRTVRQTGQSRDAAVQFLPRASDSSSRYNSQGVSWAGEKGEGEWLQDLEVCELQVLMPHLRHLGVSLGLVADGILMSLWSAPTCLNRDHSSGPTCCPVGHASF